MCNQTRNDKEEEFSMEYHGRIEKLDITHLFTSIKNKYNNIHRRQFTWYPQTMCCEFVNQDIWSVIMVCTSRWYFIETYITKGNVANTVEFVMNQILWEIYR